MFQGCMLIILDFEANRALGKFKMAAKSGLVYFLEGSKPWGPQTKQI